MQALIKPVADIIRSTRPMLLPHFGNVAFKDKGGGPIDSVTELDLAVEKYLSEELSKLDSTIGFVGEEFGGDRNKERFWLCDPIDGTGQFIRGLPYCTVMLALIEKGEVTLSFIYDFVHDNLYTAIRGGGAFKNDTPIRVSDRDLKQSYVGWETHLDKPENVETLLKLRDRTVLFKTLSAGHEFVLVATGKIEGRIHFDPHGKDYDFAPGSLLVAEAGGKVANLGSSTYDYRNRDLIAANPKVFAELTEGPDAIFPIQ